MTPDLFADPDCSDPLQELRDSFEAWAATRSSHSPSATRATGALRQNSIEVYRDMWEVFSHWCVERRYTLRNIDQAALLAFLDSLGPHGDTTVRYQKRMLQLIARIERHAAKQARRDVNLAFSAAAAQPHLRFANSAENEPLLEFLTGSEAKSLIQYITARPGGLSGDSKWSWQSARDRTAIAVQLGAGLTPGEVRTLKLHQVNITGGRVKGEPWAISLPGNGNFPARQTPLAGWAGRQVGYWLKVRADLAIPGEQLFPSTRTGKEWSKTNSFLAFKAVLAEAGISHSAGGSFKLRHTFALRQLTRYSAEEVGRWLGVQDPAIMARYSRVLLSPVDVI